MIQDRFSHDMAHLGVNHFIVVVVVELVFDGPLTHFRSFWAWSVIPATLYLLGSLPVLSARATEIFKSKSVCSTDDVIDVIRTCVRQSQIVTKTNDSSFSSKSISEIDYFSNTL